MVVFDPGRMTAAGLPSSEGRADKAELHPLFMQERIHVIVVGEPGETDGRQIQSVTVAPLTVPLDKN